MVKIFNNSYLSGVHCKVLATSSIEKDNPPIASNNTCLIEKNKFEEIRNLNLHWLKFH